MEIIKKQISIDACRSHKQGLLPYIHSISGSLIEETSKDNNNYGHFVCDLSGTTGIIKYLDIIEKYNTIKKILRLAHYCKCIKLKNSGVALKKCDYINFNDNSIKCDNICEDIKKPFNYEPLDNNFIVLDENTFIPEGEHNLKIGNNYVIINNFNFYNRCEKWAKENKLVSNNLGDYFQFIQYVDENIINSKNAINSFTLVSPYVEIPVLFEEEYVNDTLYYPYEYSISGTEKELITISGESFSAIVGTEIVNIEVENEDEVSINKQFISGITVESRLQKLIHPSAIEVANGYIGFLNSWEKEVNNDIITEAGAIFECVFKRKESETVPTIEINEKDVFQIINISNKEENSNMYEWWECRLIDNEDGFQCYEGDVNEEFIDLNYRDNINSDFKYFRKITILSCLKNYINTPNDGDIYYFMARYKNGKMLIGNGEKTIRNINAYDEIEKLSLPFKIGEPVNVETYNDVVIYDQILNFTTNTVDDNKFCRFTYVIGATSGETNTGIIYTESLRYNPDGYIENIWVDGVINGDLYYEMLDYDTNINYHFNEHYGVSSKVRESKIIEMETNNFKTYKYPLITRDGTERLFFEPKLLTDIIFDRGNASAWEKHFKLSECNTMRDLENYGNNIFNL